MRFRGNADFPCLVARIHHRVRFAQALRCGRGCPYSWRIHAKSHLPERRTAARGL
jgi:hypothetical protein